MTTKYTHLELNKEVSSIAGYYIPEREVRLKYNNREVLYVVGHATVEASCCAAGSWGYAIVPGYVLHWKQERNEAGLSVSAVEPISDEETRKNISQIIREAEGISQVEFW